MKVPWRKIKNVIGYIINLVGGNRYDEKVVFGCNHAGCGRGSASVANAESFKIGLSNGWVGSEWRTQMIEEAQAAAEEWKAKGVDVEVVVQSGNVDAQGQLVRCATLSTRALMLSLSTRIARLHLTLYLRRQSVAALWLLLPMRSLFKDAIYVGIDQKQWAYQSAKWLAETLEGKGNVVTINGVAGNPANEMRVLVTRKHLLPILISRC